MLTVEIPLSPAGAIVGKLAAKRPAFCWRKRGIALHKGNNYCFIFFALA